jgi:hypothetical protein
MTIIFHQNEIVCLFTVVKDLSAPLTTRNLIKLQSWFRRPLPRFRTGRFFYSSQHSPLLRVDISTRTLNSQIFIQLKGSLRNWLERITCPNAELPAWRLEINMSVTMKIYLFWDVISCTLVEEHRSRPNGCVPTQRHIEGKGKVFLAMSLRHVGGAEVQLHSILTSALDGGESSSRLCHFICEKQPWYPLNRRLGGPQSYKKRVMSNTRGLRNWFYDYLLFD